MILNDTAQYDIVRFYAYHPTRSRVLRKAVSLTEARDHCRNRETSSDTCTHPGGRKRTQRFGPWFDGYRKAG